MKGEAVKESGSRARVLSVTDAPRLETERLRLYKMIYLQCYARNAIRATRCRKCGSRELRPKAKGARKE